MDEDVKVPVEETPATETPVEPVEAVAEQKERSVPLNKFLSEKEKRKAVERELAEYKRKADESPTKNYLEKYKALGFDEDAAKAIAEDLAALSAKTAKKDERDIIGEELDDMVLEDEFFDDAKSFEKEIRQAILDSNGRLDARAAYLKVRSPSERARELANRGRAAPATMKAQPVSTQSAVKSDALTDEDRKNMEKMKELMPEFGWTAETYKKFYRDR